ncbi:endonuclease I [Tenacibaculum finnmarkense]|uniref:endonuclease n=2 Tax=Tenacibaculum finnmarkense TaxID=2781243 RepID=UPI001EFAC896|nr:endonuclease [Tenacibaculum finnmarkense]MCG8761356.1 endonuclease I [Tenacibaculum finnmarkense]MCG8786730.1 endonuclease I [Tenacibaculum finnmarkense]MCG8812517.1 endonuclease I [Tenacibaculum finnmarkense]
MMMKRVLLLGFATLFLINCGGNTEDIIKPEPIPVQADKIVAKDDAFKAIENTVIELPSFLSNDEYSSRGSITVTFDAKTTNNGSIERERELYTYTPAKNFSGTDTFTYTICSKDTPDICETATVSISVSDKGTPQAVDDIYNTGINSALIISSYLDNDMLIDGAKIESINTEASNATVVLNADGTISYTPLADFLGKDTFTYTICDNDPTNSCATATITVNVIKAIAFNIPAELAAYYSGVSFVNDTQSNYEALKDLLKRSHSNILKYTDRHKYLYNADEDLNNTANVVLMYTGESRDRREYTSGSNPHQTQTYNTEHIYPQSKLASANHAISRTDLHHLRACDDKVNTRRSNLPFIDGSGVAKKDNNAWYPGDQWKGDVARMVFYLNARYGETFDKVGSKELFLKWNKEDPVSDFEKQRNNTIAKVQGNRNPFIDNPYLVTLTWGGASASNTWK